MTRRAVYERAGGFDAAYLRAYHDIDFCLRVRGEGYLVVWTPASELAFRTAGGAERARRAARSPSARRDRRRFEARWTALITQGDPYYNPNLTRDWEDFSLGY